MADRRATYRMNQCATDSHVWMGQKEGDDALYGLMVAYADDTMFLMPGGAIKAGLQDHLQTIWEMKATPFAAARLAG